MENKITCPSCGHSFEAEQAIEQKIKQQFNEKWKIEIAKRKLENDAEIAKNARENEAKLAFLKSEYDKNLSEDRKNLLEERKKIEILTKEKLKSEFEQELKSSKEEVESKSKLISELKSKEIEFVKKERAFLEIKDQLELDFQKRILEEQKNIQDLARKKAEDENQFKLLEKDKKLEQLKEQIEIMKKKAEQGSMQLQGEVQEIALEELLKITFPFDTISEVGKGIMGADAIQTVRNAMGNVCGSIIYESKRTKNFSNEWIDKLKNDLRTQKSDIAVIVTETMPKDMDKFGQKDGIWICTFAEIKGVATVLRESIIRIHEVRSAQENKGDKMQFLYDFLTGNEFKQQVESMVEGFTYLREGLMKEKLAMHKIWTEREKQIDKVMFNMSGMYGAIKGIAGNAISDVKMLELGE